MKSPAPGDKCHGASPRNTNLLSPTIPFVQSTSPLVTEICETSVEPEILPSSGSNTANSEELPIRIATYIPENNVVRCGIHDSRLYYGIWFFYT